MSGRSRTTIVERCLVVAMLAMGVTMLAACDTTPQQADHRGWVYTWMTTDAPGPLPDALEGEVKQSFEWTTNGVGSVYGQGTTNLRKSDWDAQSNFCGSHGPLNITWIDGPCLYAFPVNDQPWGAMEMQTHREYMQDLAAPPISYSKYYHITINAKIRIEHRSGNNRPAFIPSCPHDGEYYGESGVFCSWEEQY